MVAVYEIAGRKVGSHVVRPLPFLAQPNPLLPELELRAHLPPNAEPQSHVTSFQK